VTDLQPGLEKMRSHERSDGAEDKRRTDW